MQIALKHLQSNNYVTCTPLQQFVDAISNIRIKHVGAMTKCFSLHMIAKRLCNCQS
jgi:hypothetical protein